jgi:hypothetical protein
VATTFISYRRDDSAGYAGRLHEALERRLGPHRIFRDVDTLRPGEDFVRAITERVRQCRVFLVLIGQEWLDARDAAGRRRLDLDEDYVRLEIAAALNRDDLLLVPVLIEGAAMPAARELPESIRTLANRHTISLRDETWDADVDRLAALVLQNETHGAASSEPADRGLPHARGNSRRSLWIAGAAAIVVLAALLIVATQVDRDGGPSASSSAASALSPAMAYAIRVPNVAEVAHGSVLYTLVAGSVGPHGPAHELRLRFRASNEGLDDAKLENASFRLAVDERVLTPTSRLNQVLAGRSIDEVFVTFDIPPGTSRATLRISSGQSVGELPLDLLPTGRPAEDDRADAGNALSRAILFSLQREPAPLVKEAGGLEAALQSATGRRFANLTRLMFSVRIANSGRYPRASGDLILRLAADQRVLAPVDQPNEGIEPASELRSAYVFDVPPATRRVVVRAMVGDTTGELGFDLPE